MSQSLLTEAGSLESLVGRVADEFLQRQRQGDRPRAEEYCNRYPEAAPVLGKVLASLEVLDLSASGPAAAADGDPPSGLLGGLLGDFRILGEVGRGGMGIVFEAEQISLGRRVALKVLPFAATLDPRHLQRFHNEARAAASLDHPHIVHVHAVGQERGVHYYAMQFIDGQSLATFVAQQHHRGGPPGLDQPMTGSTPTAAPPAAETAVVMGAPTVPAPRDAAYFRKVAEWGIQAAEALEHAHSLGIVHRDIKPANMIIDGQANLWVTDFGLARTATDAGLTMTGDVLGTLRFMSPEQALARHGLVDHRTDIYSLGVTLYELLTLTPAVEGKDREEILNAITLDEPRPARARDPAIPKDLETIVGKAMAKSPPERYGTAQELAADLRRFLEARPIQARRPTLLQRVIKWAQRHRALVVMGVAALALTAAASMVSAAMIWREKEHTRVALGQAQTERQRAETNFQEAFWAVEDLLCALDPDRSTRPVTVAELRHWQTESALRFLAPFCEDQGEEPSVRLQKGAAYVHTGRVYQVLGDREKAQNAFHRAIAVYDRLVQDFPDDSAYAGGLGTALHILAEDLYLAGRIPEANAYYSQAIRVFREAVRNHPTNAENARTLAFSLCLWFDPELRDANSALGPARTAVDLAPHVPQSWRALGIAYYRTGRWDAAADALEGGLKVGRQHDRQFDRTIALFFLAMAHWRRGKHEEAMQAFREAQRRMETFFNARDALDQAIRLEAAAVLGIKGP